MFPALVRSLNIYWLFAVGLVLTAARVEAAVTLPVLTGVVRTSPAIVAPGDPVSYTLTYTEGSNPLLLVRISFIEASGLGFTLSMLPSASGGVLTTTVGSGWLNGNYRITDVLFLDSANRVTTYYPDGSLTSNPPLVGAPVTHAISLTSQGLQVTGAQSSYTLPILNSITRESAGMVSPGDEVVFNLAYTNGSFPINFITVTFEDPSGAEQYITGPVYPSGGVASKSVTDTWLNGLYKIKTVRLTDNRWITYCRDGSVVVGPDLAGVPTTHGLDLASRDFRVTGGLTSIILPTLTSVTRISDAMVRGGDPVNFQVNYVSGNTPLASIHVVLLHSFGSNQTPNIFRPISGDVATIDSNTGWSEGAYVIEHIKFIDVYNRETRFARDGSILVSPSLSGAPATHSVSFTGQDLQLVQQPAITDQPQDLQTAPGVSFTLSAQATGVGIQYQWYRGMTGTTTDPIAGATSASLVTQVGNVSSFWVRISNLAGTVDSRTVTVSVGTVAQTITFGALPNKASGDAPFILQAVASSGLPVTFEVVSGPASIAGSTVTLTGTGSVTIRAKQAGNASFAAAPNIDQSFTVTGPVVLASRLVNISTRSYVGTGADVQIAGFIINGNAPKTLIIRASGPALTKYGVSGVLNDPAIELRRSGEAAVLSSNDNWEAASLQPVFQTAGIDNWEVGSKDSAMLVTLNPGGYTAVVSGTSGATGVALIEVYEVGNSDSKLVNISTRSLVRSGSEVQIAGFIISGNQSKQVLIRASGPALANFGVPGVLVDPVMTIHQNGIKASLTTNDDWDAGTIRPVFQKIGIDNWPVGSKDSAVVLTLNPGGYTAVVTGKNNASGVALIEVYEVN